MKYTIDGPEMAFEAYIGGAKEHIAVLVHLPAASNKTAAMFGRYAAKTWLDQPEYACFEEKEGSRVIRWDNSTINIKSNKQLEALTVGHLKMRRITGEISSYGKVWVVDNVKVTEHYEK